MKSLIAVSIAISAISINGCAEQTAAKKSYTAEQTAAEKSYTYETQDTTVDMIRIRIHQPRKGGRLVDIVPYESNTSRLKKNQVMLVWEYEER